MTKALKNVKNEKCTLKDLDPEEALAQINSKQYAIPYEIDHRKVVKVGVNFDSATRTLGEWEIEYS